MRSGEETEEMIPVREGAEANRRRPGVCTPYWVALTWGQETDRRSGKDRSTVQERRPAASPIYRRVGQAESAQTTP